jgi:hypothetical protein
MRHATLTLQAPPAAALAVEARIMNPAAALQNQSARARFSANARLFLNLFFVLTVVLILLGLSLYVMLTFHLR